MELCSKCGKKAVGRSPTGEWCNYCGDQDPCPCYNHNYCPSHDILHKHKWVDGKCKDCPAKEFIKLYENPELLN